MPDRQSRTPSDEDVLDELTRVNNELVTTQRKLARRTAQLDRALERMNLVLGMASHDLRSPIGAVRALAETVLLHAHERLEPTEVEVLERIMASSDRMLQLVNDLVELSGSQHGVRLDPAPVDLRTVVDRTVDMVRAEATDKGVSIRVDGPPHLVTTADATQLENVVTNLLGNAIKYSHRDGEILVTLADEGHHVTLAVTDHGVGIAPDEQEAIFRPFGKARRRPTEGETSTGLGLTIADRIVRAHGGRLSVASTVGRGSTFTVELPVDGPQDSPGRSSP